METEEIQKMHNELIDKIKAKFTEASLKKMIDATRTQGFDPVYGLINTAAAKQIFPFWDKGDFMFDGITFQPAKYSEVEKIYFSMERFEMDKYEGLDIEFAD